MNRRVICVLTLASLALLPLSCAAPGVQASADASKSLGSMGASLASLQASLSKCAAGLEPIATADARNAAGDLPKLFATFRDSAGKLDGAFVQIDKDAKSTDAEMKKYLEQRRKTNETIGDLSIREIDSKQIADLAARFDAATASYGKLSQQIAPLKTSVDSLETYLQNNLNVGGIKAGGATMQQVADQIRAFEPLIAAASSDYAKLASALVPPKDSAN